MLSDSWERLCTKKEGDIGTVFLQMDEPKRPDIVVYDLNHLDVFSGLSPEVLDRQLADAHIIAGESFASNDRASLMRMMLLSGVDGLPTPYGVARTLPVGPVRPFYTTWAAIPSPYGEIPTMVNCVTPLDGDRFKLVNGDANALPSFQMQYQMFEDKRAILDTMLGLSWKPERQIKMSDPLVVKASVFLLGGVLDRDHHIFHAWEHKMLFTGRYGAGPDDTTGSTAGLRPAGPRPQLGRS